MDSLVMQLVATDYLDEWSGLTVSVSPELRRDAFSAAEPLWVERMIGEGRLYLHPDVVDDLSNAEWKPNDLQRQMIWASVLASIDGTRSKERFISIKEKLVKKYGNKWWFSTYKRVKPAYAARMKLMELAGSKSTAVSLLAANSSLIGLALHEERLSVLQKIPQR